MDKADLQNMQLYYRWKHVTWCMYYRTRCTNGGHYRIHSEWRVIYRHYTDTIVFEIKESFFYRTQKTIQNLKNKPLSAVIIALEWTHFSALAIERVDLFKRDTLISKHDMEIAEVKRVCEKFTMFKY